MGEESKGGTGGVGPAVSMGSLGGDVARDEVQDCVDLVFISWRLLLRAFYIARYTTVLGVFGLFSMIHIIPTRNTNNGMAAARQNLTGISADRTLAEALLFRPRRGRSEDPNSRQFTRSATGSHIHRFCTRNTHIAKQRSIRSSPGTTEAQTTALHS